MAEHTNDFPLFTIDAGFKAMKKSPQFYEYETWKQLQDRIVVINDDIMDDTVDDLIMPIIQWNMEDEAAGLAVEDRKPIKVFVNTHGGDLDIGFLIISVFKQSKTPIHTIALAKAYSCGSILLMAGHKRFAYEYSTVLIHDGSMMIAGSANKAKDYVQFSDRREPFLKEFYTGRSRISDGLYESKKDREWYMTGKEALELGVVDELL